MEAETRVQGENLAPERGAKVGVRRGISLAAPQEDRGEGRKRPCKVGVSGGIARVRRGRQTLHPSFWPMPMAIAAMSFIDTISSDPTWFSFGGSGFRV